MWIGDDFQSLVALLDKQLDPLTKAVQSYTGTLDTTCVWMAFDKRIKTCGRKERVSLAYDDLTGP